MSVDLKENTDTSSGNFDPVEHIIAKTVEYLKIPSVVGYEDHFLSYLYQDFKALDLGVTKVAGALEVRGDNPCTGILTAHADRHGLISLGHDEYVYAAQYMKEIKYGEPNKASQKELEDIGKRFQGECVCAYDQWTGARLGEGTIQTVEPHVMNGSALFKVEGMAEIKLGVPVAYERIAKKENGYLKGQIDNALSLAVIHTLYKRGYQGMAIIPKDEEIGKSWIHIAACLKHSGFESQDIIVIDTSPYNDSEPIEKGQVVFRNRDSNAIFNPALVNRLKERCTALGIGFQFKDETLLAKGKTTEQLGSTELGKLIKNTAGRWSGASVQIPTLMYHTSNETTSLAAIANYYGFLANILIHDPLGVTIINSATPA
ncbi:MAG: hypothetical protein ACT4OY_07075 [Alphaproteobacteria bacterium]